MFLFTVVEGGKTFVFLTYFCCWINFVAHTCGKFTFNFCSLPFRSLLFLICWCCDLENFGERYLADMFIFNFAFERGSFVVSLVVEWVKHWC